MKSYSLLFSLFLILFSCRVIDDSDIPCGNECVEIQGKVVSNDGEPLSGLDVYFQFREYGTSLLGDNKRRIAATKTDGEGNYYMKGLINDNELGDTTNGRFEAILRLADLDYNVYSVSRNELANPPVNYQLTRGYSYIFQKDTSIFNSYFIPRATQIDVRLSDFHPESDSDDFSVSTGLGLDISEENIQHQPEIEGKIRSGRTGYCSLIANDSVFTSDSTFTIWTYAGLENNIIIRKRKNGVSTEEKEILFVPLENDITLNYSF